MVTMPLSFSAEEMLLMFIGDINTDGTGEDWEYKDGFAQRLGGGPQAFDLKITRSIMELSMV